MHRCLVPSTDHSNAPGGRCSDAGSSRSPPRGGEATLGCLPSLEEAAPPERRGATRELVVRQIGLSKTLRSMEADSLHWSKPVTS